jgi:hypothetical protein
MIRINYHCKDLSESMTCVSRWFWEMVAVLQMVEDGSDDDAKYSAHAHDRGAAAGELQLAPLKGQ